MTCDLVHDAFDNNVDDIEDVINHIGECVDIVDLGENELKIGTMFRMEAIAVNSIQHRSEKTFCPLSKVGFTKLQA